MGEDDQWRGSAESRITALEKQVEKATDREQARNRRDFMIVLALLAYFATPIADRLVALSMGGQ